MTGERGGPMFEDVICLSHLRWGFVFQRPNHLMSRYAKDRRVFFVEEPVFDAASPPVDVTVAQDGVHVVVPHVPGGPPPDVVERQQRDLLEALLEREHVREPLLWFYTPM